MEDLFALSPAVPGREGEGTIVKNESDYQMGKVFVPDIERFIYEFLLYSVDDILKTSGYYIVSERLRDAIVSAGLTGATFQPCEVVKESQYEELWGNEPLPNFVLLVARGQIYFDLTGKIIQWDGSDVNIGICHDYEFGQGNHGYLRSPTGLMVTQRFLDVLDPFEWEDCHVVPMFT